MAGAATATVTLATPRPLATRSRTRNSKQSPVRSGWHARTRRNERLGGPVSDEKPIPAPDHWSLPYWEAARAGRLVIQTCNICGRMQFPPDLLCRYCQADDLRFDPVSGRGRVQTFAVYVRSFTPGYEAPFSLAFVQLVEDPTVRLMTNLVEAELDELEVGMPVEVVFESRGEWMIPQFRPVKEGAR